MRGGRLVLIAGSGEEPDDARGEYQIALPDETLGSHLYTQVTKGQDLEQTLLDDFEDDLPMTWICGSDVEEGSERP